MDIVKQFMKIGGFKTPQDLEAYGEENFFRDFPEARKYAKGGSIEAYPQTATFDNFFSYGVPPGPQYLKQGGSAYPQAQTEEQFFIPIYTDVYNPYNKAMGGSNVEMYPNAKTTPHWGPSNIFFQDGGEGQEEPEGPDRMGVLNTTGSFVANLKNKANQANNKNAMMNAVSKYGFKNGGPLTKYQDKGAVTEASSAGNLTYTEPSPQRPLTAEEIALAQKFNINDPGISPDGTRGKIKQMQRESWIDQQMSNPGYGGMIFDPAQAAAVRAALQQGNFPFYGPGFSAGQPLYNHPGMIAEYPLGPTGNMGNFLDNYFAYTTDGPFAGSTTKGRVRVDGQRAGNFYGNMPLIKGFYPEIYKGKGNFEDLMKNNADFRNRADAMGLTGYKEPTGLKKLFGSREYTFNQRVPYQAPTVTLDPKPKAPQNTTDMSVKDLMNMVGKIPNETPTSSSDNVFRSKYTVPLMSETTPYDGVEVSGLGSTSDSNTFNSNDPQQRGAMLKGIIDGATPDSFDDMLPEQKFGGSYRKGDVVYMSDDEIAEFIRNGGQIEEMD